MKWHVILYSIGFSVICGGCTTTVQSARGEPLRIGSSEFRAYAERVFRLQNAVASELAFALDETGDRSPAELDALERAEDALLAACERLNLAAARRRAGGGVRPLADARTARSVPDCERAAVAGRSALESAAERRQ